MINEQKKIQINLSLYGWSGELLETKTFRGSRNFLVPKGYSVLHFLSEWLLKNDEFKDFFFDLDRNDFKSDVMVLLNGSRINPKEKTILRSGDSLSVLRVAGGG